MPSRSRSRSRSSSSAVQSSPGPVQSRPGPGPSPAPGSSPGPGPGPVHSAVDGPSATTSYCPDMPETRPRQSFVSPPHACLLERKGSRIQKGLSMLERVLPRMVRGPDGKETKIAGERLVSPRLRRLPQNTINILTSTREGVSRCDMQSRGHTVRPPPCF